MDILTNASTLKAPRNNRNRWWAYLMARGFLLIGITILVMLGPISSLFAEENRQSKSVLVASEYRLKAAFLYYFIIYTDWPSGVFENSSSPFVIGVMGKPSTVDTIINEISQKVVKGRRIEIRQASNREEVLKCNLVYITKAQRSNINGILNQLKNQKILTVGETENFVHRGGLINFYEQDNRVRFEINLDEAEKIGFKFRSKLLRLARIKN